MSTNPEDKANGWAEWSRYVLKELERLNAVYTELRNDLGETNKNVIEVKAKIDGFLVAKDLTEKELAEIKAKQMELLQWKAEQKGKSDRANLISIVALIATGVMVIINIAKALGL
jgi:hypothetical protein